jgi:uncharacterized damage-inducible protein DinB
MRNLLVIGAVCAVCAVGQDGGLSAANRQLYGMAKSNVVKSAENMPEENYSFKPTPEVRSFGQLVGHVSDANYTFCSAVLGEKSPVSGIEKGKTSKADLVAAVKASFEYCDKAYELPESDIAQKVTFFGQERPKLTILEFNNMHDMEHYGNMVTYLRLKNLVPPSSAQRPPAAQSTSKR